MTRAEARMIAEELGKVIVRQTEELLTAGELAKLLKVKESYIRKNSEMFPSVKFGGNRRYPKSKVLESILE